MRRRELAAAQLAPRSLCALAGLLVGSPAESTKLGGAVEEAVAAVSSTEDVEGGGRPAKRNGQRGQFGGGSGTYSPIRGSREQGDIAAQLRPQPLMRSSWEIVLGRVQRRGRKISFPAN